MHLENDAEFAGWADPQWERPIRTTAALPGSWPSGGSTARVFCNWQRPGWGARS